MKTSIKAFGIGLSAVSILASCAAEDMPSGSLQSMDYSGMSEEWLDVGISLDNGNSEESMNLVKAALEKYSAKLSGGVACWGDLPEVFEGEIGNAAKSLKVRKNAAGCSVTFTQVKFKGDTSSYTLATGLIAVTGRNAVFSAPSSSVRLNVVSGLVTTQDSPIQLAAEFVALDTLAESAITDGAVSVAANSDAVASPHVKVTKVESFNGKLYVDFECSNTTSTNSACKPALLGSEVQSQPLTSLKARIIQVAGKATVAETLEQLNYTTLKSRFDAASEEITATNVSGRMAKFNGLPHIKPASGNRIVLVIAFSETIGPTTGAGYKAFLLK